MSICKHCVKNNSTCNPDEDFCQGYKGPDIEMELDENVFYNAAQLVDLWSFACIAIRVERGYSSMLGPCKYARYMKELFNDTGKSVYLTPDTKPGDNWFDLSRELPVGFKQELRETVLLFMYEIVKDENSV